MISTGCKRHYYIKKLQCTKKKLQQCRYTNTANWIQTADQLDQLFCIHMRAMKSQPGNLELCIYHLLAKILKANLWHFCSDVGNGPVQRGFVCGPKDVIKVCPILTQSSVLASISNRTATHALYVCDFSMYKANPHPLTSCRLGVLQNFKLHELECHHHCNHHLSTLEWSWWEAY